MDFTMDTFAIKQSYKGKLTFMLKISFNYLNPPTLQNFDLERNGENEGQNSLIPDWINLFFFPSTEVGTNLLLQYIKYKRGELDTASTDNLSKALCPDSDVKKNNTETFIVTQTQFIDKFRNQGYLNILDSSQLCVNKQKELKGSSLVGDTQVGTMVNFELNVAILDQDKTYIEIVKCKLD